MRHSREPCAILESYARLFGAPLSFPDLDKVTDLAPFLDAPIYMTMLIKLHAPFSRAMRDSREPYAPFFEAPP